MGAVIQFKNQHISTLDTKWDHIISTLDENNEDDAIAIRMDNDGNIDIHHSAGIDPFTLIGLLEVFKTQLVQN